jgi:hypothetical protein
MTKRRVVHPDDNAVYASILSAFINLCRHLFSTETVSFNYRKRAFPVFNFSRCEWRRSVLMGHHFQGKHARTDGTFQSTSHFTERSPNRNDARENFCTILTFKKDFLNKISKLRHSRNNVFHGFTVLFKPHRHSAAI